MRDGGLRKIVARVARAQGAVFEHSPVRNHLGRTGLRRAGCNGVCRTRDGEDGYARDDERMMARDLTDHRNLLSQAALTALGMPQAMTARLINAFGQPYAFGVAPPTALRTGGSAEGARGGPALVRAVANGEAAVESLPPRLDTPLLFPASRGRYVQLDTWRSRKWYPALEAAGIAKSGPYHLRHTFATEALAGGVSIFELARLMGTSVKMIDKTYGHLARDSEESLRARLEARGAVGAEETGRR